MKDIHYYLEILTFDTSIFTIDHPCIALNLLVHNALITIHAAVYQYDEVSFCVG